MNRDMMDDGVQLNVARDSKVVLLQIGPEKWIGMSPDQAVELATLLLNNALILRKGQ